MVKNPSANARDLRDDAGLIPGSGRSPREDPLPIFNCFSLFLSCIVIHICVDLFLGPQFCSIDVLSVFVPVPHCSDD